MFFPSSQSRRETGSSSLEFTVGRVDCAIHGGFDATAHFGILDMA
jgi:hypothetical protein